MIVGTTEVAQLLGVSPTRVRTLLSAGRIHGAYKIGKIWAIPLINGMPQVREGKRGPKRKWRAVCREVMTCIHVNRNLIRQNDKQEQKAPVISVKRGSSNIYGFEAEVLGPCRVVYRPDAPKPCGAKVWIETLSQVLLTG